MPTRIVLTLLLTGLVWDVNAKPTRFEVKDVAFRNVVIFISDAPLEKTVGTTHFVSGWMEVDPAAVRSGIKGELEIDVRGFAIGPESRQSKLRETVFGTADFPGAIYKIEKLVESSSNELRSGKTVTGRVSGVLTAHGVSRRQEMVVKATYFTESEWTKRRLTGNLLKVSASFDLGLADYKMTIPEPLAGLVAPFFRINADIVGTDLLPVASP